MQHNDMYMYYYPSVYTDMYTYMHNDIYMYYHPSAYTDMHTCTYILAYTVIATICFLSIHWSSFNYTHFHHAHYDITADYCIWKAHFSLLFFPFISSTQGIKNIRFFEIWWSYCFAWLETVFMLKNSLYIASVKGMYILQ